MQAKLLHLLMMMTTHHIKVALATATAHRLVGNKPQ